MADTYQRNLQALKQVNPRLAEHLASIRENQRYEVFMGNDPIDINILDTQTNTPMYDFPIEAARDVLNAFGPYSRYPFLCFFGIGNGIAYKAMLENQAFKHLMVVEPQLELIYIAFNFADFSQEIAQGRFVVYWSREFGVPTVIQFANQPDVGLFIRLYDLHLHSPYYALFNQEMVQTNKIFVDALLQYAKTHGNDANDSLVGIEHFIKNLPEIFSHPPVMLLKDARNSDLAVLVATGPSLSKQLPLLKEIQDFVTIISVDASLPILENEGIVPDIVTSLERVELTAKFFQRTSDAFKTRPLMIHSAVQHRAVLDASGPNKIIAMRPFGYMQQLGYDPFGYVGIGMSAANLSYEIAYLMGFKRVVFIGQDLAYGKEGTSHAKDHTFGEDEVKQGDEDIFLPAYGGEGSVRSTPVWLMFLNYFLTYISDVGGEVESINATEGGARIFGTVEMPFSQVVAEYVDRSRPKKVLALQAPSSEAAKRYQKEAWKRIDEMIAEGEEKKARLEELFLETAELAKTIEPLYEKEEWDAIDLEAVRSVNEKIDAIKTIFDEERFHRCYWDTVRSFIVHQEMQIAKIVVRPAKTRHEEIKKHAEFLLAHRSWLFSLAGGIDAQIAVIRRGRGEGKEA